MMRRLLPVLALTVLLVAAFTATTSAAPHCASDQDPQFLFGFAHLKTLLGEKMGDPSECEHANPENGDTLQQTTTGLSFYRKSTNIPTFTNSFDHWGWTTSGLVSWTGDAIDAPGYEPPSDCAGNLLGVDSLVAAIPVCLGKDPFYKKYLDAGGIPIISSGLVEDEAPYAAREIVNNILVTRPDIRAALISNGAYVGVIAVSEATTDIPEYEYLKDAPLVDWNFRARGLPGTVSRPITTDAEENLLCYKRDGWRGANILIHELAHTITNLGLPFMAGGDDVLEEVRDAYAAGIEKGLWTNTFAATNASEYWAEMVQTWFNAQRQNVPGLTNHVDTREELIAYDPEIASIISNVFRDNNWRYECPTAQPEN